MTRSKLRKIRRNQSKHSRLMRTGIPLAGMVLASSGVVQAQQADENQGLEEVVNVGTPGGHGTAYTPFHERGELAIRVAGKTSTAEHRHGAAPHAWFAGYAPADNPQVSFVVMLEEAGHGGKAAAPLAYKFLKDVYGTRSAPVKNPGAPREVVSTE